LTGTFHYDTKKEVKSYTICLIGLEQRRVVVVGGGRVASRKVEALLDSGASITVISPLVTGKLEELAASKAIEVIRRPYSPGDLGGAYLVIAATDDVGINHSVWAEAVDRGCLVNVVDNPQHSNFTLPALVRRGDLTIAISTGGSSPALARRLRERLEDIIEAEYSILAEIMGKLRPELMSAFASGDDRLEAALRIIDSDILTIIKERGKEAALAYGRQKLHQG
jgi:siroheme synthase-like protein